MITEFQRFLCEILFCLSGAHPWDYTYHFFFNFAGVITGYIILRHFHCRNKISVSLPLLFLGSFSIYKENLDKWASDAFGDMLANALGIALALASIYFLARVFQRSTFSHS